ncbi:MAG TPA: hypothetical protein PKI73_02455 [Petrotogaceae bacterium]|nr:hypothetical protein [Petrotogaceae bacterium]HOG34615.1 hypothetical protein [Petrotogaceae bacterium]HQC41772.1 hypothetical protein [Petrotogaceae bacterium]
MKSFKELLDTEKKLLIVSLPDNSCEYALRAYDAGADAVKFHVNIKHRVTQNTYNTWKDFKKTFEYIISQIDIPAGIVPGAEIMSSIEDFKDMERSGVTFIDCYYEYAPRWIKTLSVHKMLAVNHTFKEEELDYLVDYGADSIELSFIDPSQYGKALTVKDCINYERLSKKCHSNCFIPSQKFLTIDDLEVLNNQNIKGIILGAVVTGSDPKTFSDTIKNFRDGLDKSYGR